MKRGGEGNLSVSRRTAWHSILYQQDAGNRVQKKTSVEAISPLQLVTLQMAQWLWSQQPGGVTEEYFLKPAAGNGRLHAYAHGCLVNYVGARACYLLTRPATSLCGRWG